MSHAHNKTRNVFSSLTVSVLLLTGFLPNVHAESIKSKAYVVYDLNNGKMVEGKNEKQKLPIASITKLMTAMVALDKKPNLDKEITIEKADVDTLLHTTSRLKVGTTLTMREALNLALMSSENRAASAISRNYPGGKPAFVRAMNEKAKRIGMKNTQFFDSTGLESRNQATASDLVNLVKHANNYALIKDFTTTAQKDFELNQHDMHYVNTNPLIRFNNSQWDISVSKTGYTEKAGKCIVLLSEVDGKPYIFSLLGSRSKETRLQDLALLKDKVKSKKG